MPTSGHTGPCHAQSVTFGGAGLRIEIDRNPAGLDRGRFLKTYLNRWVLPKWHRERALGVRPFQVEDWFKEIEREHHLETATLAEIRKVLNLVYRHGQRHGLLPRGDDGNPMVFVRLAGDRNSTSDSKRESVA